MSDETALADDNSITRAHPRNLRAMIGPRPQISAGSVVRLRPIALPVEHGGWGLVFEPIVLGLLLAPSLAGLFLSIAAIGAFLARQPFKLVVGDWRRQRRSARTPLAERFALLYFVIAALALAFSIKIGDERLLLPLLLAVPLALVQLFNDALGRSRALTAEVAGSIAVGALATAIALASGWTLPAAFGLWLILTARNVPTILYLRARLKLKHRQPASRGVVIMAHLLAILLVIGFVRSGVVPFLAVVALVILLVRALVGFSESTGTVTAKKLGLRELGFGAMTVLAVFLGHVFRL